MTFFFIQSIRLYKFSVSKNTKIESTVYWTGLLYGAKRQGTRVASKVATEAKMTKAGLQSTISSGAKFTLAIK